MCLYLVYEPTQHGLPRMSFPRTRAPDILPRDKKRTSFALLQVPWPQATHHTSAVRESELVPVCKLHCIALPGVFVLHGYTACCSTWHLVFISRNVQISAQSRYDYVPTQRRDEQRGDKSGANHTYSLHSSTRTRGHKGTCGHTLAITTNPPPMQTYQARVTESYVRIARPRA